MRFLFIATIVLAFPVVAMSVTIHVPAGQPTIQAGIDTAVDGDTVLVAPGTYVENIDFMGKAITVESAQGAEATVIDGGDPVNPDVKSVVVFNKSESQDSVLEGFTVTNGAGTSYEIEPGNWEYCGGGIYCVGTAPR